MIRIIRLTIMNKLKNKYLILIFFVLQQTILFSQYDSSLISIHSPEGNRAFNELQLMYSKNIDERHYNRQVKHYCIGTNSDRKDFLCVCVYTR